MTNTPLATAQALGEVHDRLLSAMTADQRLVLTREMEAARMRLDTLLRNGLVLSRKETLDAVLAAEGEGPDHTLTLIGMDADQLLVLARELLADRMVRGLSARRKVDLTRQEAFEAIFATEAEARARGAQPKVDVFLPLDNDFMEAPL